MCAQVSLRLNPPCKSHKLAGTSFVISALVVPILYPLAYAAPQPVLLLLPRGSALHFTPEGRYASVLATSFTLHRRGCSIDSLHSKVASALQRVKNASATLPRFHAPAPYHFSKASLFLPQKKISFVSESFYLSVWHLSPVNGKLFLVMAL